MLKEYGKAQQSTRAALWALARDAGMDQAPDLFSAARDRSASATSASQARSKVDWFQGLSEEGLWAICPRRPAAARCGNIIAGLRDMTLEKPFGCIGHQRGSAPLSPDVRIMCNTGHHDSITSPNAIATQSTSGIQLPDEAVTVSDWTSGPWGVCFTEWNQEHVSACSLR